MRSEVLCRQGNGAEQRDFPISSWSGLCKVRPGGGEGGIRTHGTREGTTVFETVPIDHSGTSPQKSGCDRPEPGGREARALAQAPRLAKRLARGGTRRSAYPISSFLAVCALSP